MTDRRRIRVMKFLSVLGIAFICLLAYRLATRTIDATHPDVAQYKCQPGASNRNPSDPNIMRPEGAIRVIRLTDNGEFIDRCELTEVLYDLACEQHPGAYGSQRRCRPEAVGLPKLTLLYVHGWKHGSDPDDSDYLNFKKLIDQLAESNKSKKNVVGIYVSWQADVKWLPWIFKNLSFWDKKAVADNIARAGAVTGIVGSVAAFSNSARGRGDQFFAIGHSFGARILFSATSQSIIYETNRSHPGYARGTYKPVKAAADAVILLNPAFEAAHFSFIDGFRRGKKGSEFTSPECSEGNIEDRDEEKFSGDQTPLLLSISSSGDYATRFAFPAGAFLAFDFGRRQRTTIGNYCNFATHTLRKTNANGNDCESDEPTRTINTFKAEGLCLVRKKDVDRYQVDNPFMVAETTSDIIEDHNDIWNEKFSIWLLAFVKALERRIEETSQPARN